MQDREVELKFALPAEALAGLEQHARLAAAIETERDALRSVYFDTPDHLLKSKGLVCRVRSIGERRIQTVKALRGDGVGRDEWECEIAGEVPDAARVPRAAANATLHKPAVVKALAAVFATEVERKSWVVQQGASLVEVSLDRGQIVSRQRNRVICELELELKDGRIQDLFTLARELGSDTPLQLDLLAKSHGGYRLATNGHDVETELEPPPLQAATSLHDGFRAIAYACLRHLMTNEPALRARQDPEALHQTRTALRRLRAVLRVFGRHVEDDRLPALRDGLKWLSRLLGLARDVDVMREGFAKHRKTAELAEGLGEQHVKAYRKVLAALGSQRYRDLLLDLCEWLECGPWTTIPPRKRSRGTMADVCALEFSRWDRKLVARGARLAELDAEERHAIRIRAKSLYYVCALTEGLTPRGARKARRAYLAALKKLQSTLGKLNDAEVAKETLQAMRDRKGAGGKALSAATAHAAERHARREHAWIDDAAQAFADFAEAPRFWTLEDPSH